MTTITATELKENLGKYILLAQTEDVRVTKNGKPAVRLVSATKSRPVETKPVKSISELFGTIHGDIDIKEARLERLKEKCGL